MKLVMNFLRYIGIIIYYLPLEHISNTKVDYSRHIQEASMEMEGILEVNPPSDRVPGQRLLAAPILKRRRRRNKEEIGKRASGVEGFCTGGKYRRKGASRGPRRPLDAIPPLDAPLGRLRLWWVPSGPHLVIPEASDAL